MRNHVKSIALAMSLVMFAAPALAEEPPADVAIIKRAGAPTPFPGVLFSEEAYARMKAEQEIAKERFDGKLRLELGLLESRLKLATATTANDLAATKRSAQERFEIKDQRIKQLEDDLVKANDRATTSTWEKIAWYGLGVASVVVGALAIKWAADR